jgi:hypothetical protein
MMAHSANQAHHFSTNGSFQIFAFLYSFKTWNDRDRERERERESQVWMWTMEEPVHFRGAVFGVK